MQFDKFVDTHKGDRRPKVEYHGRQKELLDEADRWSDFFSDVLLDRFNREGEFMPPQQAVNLLRGYYSWATTQLQPEFLTMAANVRTERSRRLVNRLNFHMLNQAFMQQWLPFLVGYRPPDAIAEREKLLAKDHAACSAVDLMKLREKIPLDDYYDDNLQANMRRRAYEGTLTEYDAAITLLESTRNHPELTVLPAPSSFEHSQNQGNANADFMVLDLAQYEVIGAQSKSFVSDKDRERYDSDRVMLLDGVVDMGNTSRRHGRLRTSRPTAGLIAAEHILGAKTHGKSTSAIFRLPQFQQRVQQAKFFVKTHEIDKPTMQPSRAAKLIGQRVTHYLYRNPVLVEEPEVAPEVIAS